MNLPHSVYHGDNPFEFDGAHDLLQPIQSDIEFYSETMFFIAVNPQTGDSVFVDVGRQPGDLHMWWAQTIVVLADGRIVADRSFGRAPDDRGPATGNLTIRCVEPRQTWQLKFDGAGELTSGSEMATRVVGAGLATRMSFDIEFRAAAPVCDFAKVLGSEAFDWANAHQEQNLWSTGKLRISGDVFDISGVGFRDHSTGPRDFSKMGAIISPSGDSRGVGAPSTHSSRGRVTPRRWGSGCSGSTKMGPTRSFPTSRCLDCAITPAPNPGR